MEESDSLKKGEGGCTAQLWFLVVGRGSLLIVTRTPIRKKRKNNGDALCCLSASSDFNRLLSGV